MIRLVAFDFDGTLADTRDLIIDLMYKVMRLYGWEQPSEEECASIIGLPLKEGFKKIFPGHSDEEIDDRCAKHRAYFFENCASLVPVAFDGVRETLDALRQRGVKMTIASSRNKPSLVSYLNGMGFLEFFDLIIGPEDVPCGKPDPAPILKTVEMTGVAPDEILVVGDTSYDILMGVRAGAHTCGVSFGVGSVEGLKEAGAEHIVDNIADILKFL